MNGKRNTSALVAGLFEGPSPGWKNSSVSWTGEIRPCKVKYGRTKETSQQRQLQGIQGKEGGLRRGREVGDKRTRKGNVCVWKSKGSGLAEMLRQYPDGERDVRKPIQTRTSQRPQLGGRDRTGEKGFSKTENPKKKIVTAGKKTSEKENTEKSRLARSVE